MAIHCPHGQCGTGQFAPSFGRTYSSGEVEWLEPLTGSLASKRGILERLRREPMPHVIHFVGHGRVENNVPALRAADKAGEEAWLEVESLGQEIAANLQGKLRLECMLGKNWFYVAPPTNGRTAPAIRPATSARFSGLNHAKGSNQRDDLRPTERREHSTKSDVAPCRS